MTADINHDGRIDVLVPRGDGRLLVLLNRPGDGGRPRFDGSLALGAPTDAMEIDVGTFGAPARERLVWVDADGRLNAATLALAGASLQVGSPERLLEIGKGAHLAVGRFLGRAGRRHHRRPPTPQGRRSRLGRRDSSAARPPLSGRATSGGAPATSTATAWMTSSASGRSPRPRAALKS